MYTRKISVLFISFLLLMASLGYSGSSVGSIVVHPPIHVVLPTGIQPFAFPPGFVPSQIRAIYQLPTTGGVGTIAIIDAYDDPNIAHDFYIFCTTFGLPSDTATNFEVHKMGATIQSASTFGWDLEESLDVQWAHAIAPNAKILLVEATTNNGSDLLDAVDYAAARSDVVAVSMSFGGTEYSDESVDDSHFISAYGATFFASSGDSGHGVEWPAVSVNVVGVGGTYVNLSGTTTETAWSGSGGGLSVYEKAATYQTTFGVPSSLGFRAVPDVSYNGSSNSLVSVYDTLSYSGWVGVYGTSAGSPQWAGIRALGGSTLNNNFFYSRASSSATYALTFRDITSGTNGASGFYTKATVGYDYVTGLGSPLGNGLLSVFTAPLAGFYATPTSGYGALTVNFTDTSANNPTSWKWSFGDGGSTALQNPTHIYDTVVATTTYTVQLIVTNSYGTSTSIIPNYITVQSLPAVEDWMQYSDELRHTPLLQIQPIDIRKKD